MMSRFLGRRRNRGVMRDLDEAGARIGGGELLPESEMERLRGRVMGQAPAAGAAANAAAGAAAATEPAGPVMGAVDRQAAGVGPMGMYAPSAQVGPGGALNVGMSEGHRASLRGVGWEAPTMAGTLRAHLGLGPRQRVREYDRRIMADRDFAEGGRRFDAQTQAGVAMAEAQAMGAAAQHAPRPVVVGDALVGADGQELYRAPERPQGPLVAGNRVIDPVAGREIAPQERQRPEWSRNPENPNLWAFTDASGRTHTFDTTPKEMMARLDGFTLAQIRVMEQNGQVPPGTTDLYLRSGLGQGGGEAAGAPAAGAAAGTGPGGGKELDRETAAALLKEAGGDREKARALARERGYRF
jgi:hypothetical protein